MPDTRERFSRVTLAFHWFVGLAIIGLIALGIYMTGLPDGDDKLWLYDWHKVIGTTVLMAAAARILWRWRNGMPEPAGDYPAWEHKAATSVHVVLLIATIALPVTGALYSWGAGYPIPILGLFELTPSGKTSWLDTWARFVHGWAGWILAGIVAAHVAGALKHHLVDRDGTLKRMFGARINPSEAAAYEDLQEKTP